MNRKGRNFRGWVWSKVSVDTCLEILRVKCREEVGKRVATVIGINEFANAFI